MGKGIKEEARAQELEPVSLSELIHQHVRAAIETAVHEELRAALGTSPYERRDVRRGYRNGVRERTLTGPTGPVALTLPRATLFSGAGDVTSCSRSFASPQRSGTRYAPRTRLSGSTRSSDDAGRRKARCPPRTRHSSCSSASWRAGRSSCGRSTAGRRSARC
jgi:hypothetical protein